MKDRLKARVTRLFRPHRREQSGQTIIIAALGFITLLVLVGFAVDAALIYVGYTRLRRGVDAAAVSAVNQYREIRSVEQMYGISVETLQLQVPQLENARLYWCTYRSAEEGITLTDMQGTTYMPHIPLGSADEYGEESLCANVAENEPPRKRVRIYAWTRVDLAFLRLIGFDHLVLRAFTEAEAAVIQMVILLDTSESMAYGIDEDGDGDVDEDPNACPPSAGEYPRVSNGQTYGTFYECVRACSTEGWCSPFEQVRDAAYGFAQNTRDGVDWVSVYHFDKTPVITPSIDVTTCPSGTEGMGGIDWIPVTMTIPAESGRVVHLTTEQDEVLNAIDDNTTLNVYYKPALWEFESDCNYEPSFPWSNNYYKWTSTNVGGGIQEAMQELLNRGNPEIGVWIIVLLSDGAANTTDRACDANGWYTCPSPAGSGGPDYRSDEPRCRDPEDDGLVTRHCPHPNFCEQDWYTNQGNYQPWWYDADDYARDAADTASSKQITIFTIGFGRQVLETEGRDDAAERLLRYIADVSDDGNPDSAPCGSNYYWSENPAEVPELGEDCGNYYYAPGPNELEDVFEAIATRIFSRLTQ